MVTRLKWWQYPYCAVLWAIYIAFCVVAFIPMLIAAIWIKPGDGTGYYEMLAERERKSRT